MLQGRSQPLSKRIWRQLSLMEDYSVAVTFRMSCALCLARARDGGRTLARAHPEPGSAVSAAGLAACKHKGSSFPPAQGDAIKPRSEASHRRASTAAKSCQEAWHTVIERWPEPKKSGFREEPSAPMAQRRVLPNQTGLDVGFGAACWGG